MLKKDKKIARHTQSQMPQKARSFFSCLSFISKLNFRRTILVTFIFAIALGTVPFFNSTPAHAILATPTDAATCAKEGGTWAYVTGGGNTPFVCNIALVKLMSPQEEASSYIYYTGLKKCVANTDGAAGPGMKGTIKSSASQDGNVDPSGWFDRDGANQVIASPYAKLSCADAMTKAMALWGYGTDNKGFLIAIGYQYEADKTQWVGPSDGNMRWNQFASAVKSKVYGGTEPSPSAAAKYAQYIDQFTSEVCKAKDLGLYGSITNSTYLGYVDENHSENATNDAVKDIIPGAKGNINFAKVTVVNAAGQAEVHGYAYQSNGGEAAGCAQLPALITQYAPGWQAWLAAHPDRKVAPPNIGTGAVSGDSTEQSTCKVDGVGWIICPVTNLMAGIVDAAYGFVGSLLVVQPLLTTGNTAGIYSAWSIMRNFANVAFVIAFIIIIYSQLTGAGINNYGIKKMLPRIIVAAILVNVSYWICAIAVDLSNILGGSFNGLFEGIQGGIPDKTNSTVIATGTGWVGIAGLVLAGSATLGVAMYVGLAALLPALIAALLAIVTVFLVLTLRQALIILLIVIAPLAFVAYLLPNTESLFKKWRQLFQTMLLMYPIIAFIFGASALASFIVMKSANGQYAIVIQIMGALIAIIPLAITPLVMKTAGSLLGKFGGAINNPNKGPFDRMKKGADRVRDRQQDRRAIKSMNGGNVFGGGQFRRRAKREAIDTNLKRERSSLEQQHVAEEAVGEDGQATRFGRKLAGAGPLGGGADAGAIQRALSNATFTIDEAIAKDIKAESVTVRELDKGALKNIINDSNSPDAKKAAAMQRLVKISDPADYADEVDAAFKDQRKEGSTLRRATAEALGSDGPGVFKASDIDMWASGSHLKRDANNDPIRDAEGNTQTLSLKEVARRNVSNDVVSVEKLVGETAGNMQFAWESADSIGKAKLTATASKLQLDPILNTKIKHNATAIANMANSQAPTPPPPTP